ncbi:hypothetical protein DL93DRAFT_2101224 [Clavulina sp. PMI_390]|nr:hypothetical protein DL93DRAFT_2101224 [Clavulina sp. PMI_390]
MAVWADLPVELVIHVLQELGIRIPAVWSDNMTRDPFRNLRQFTRAAVLKPELGKHVRELDTSSLDGGVEVHNDYGVLEACEGARSDLEQIFQALASLGLTNGLVLSGGATRILILVLQFLPKLRELIIATTAGPKLRSFAHSCFGGFTGGIPIGLRLLDWIRERAPNGSDPSADTADGVSIRRMRIETRRCSASGGCYPHNPRFIRGLLAPIDNSME